MNIASPSRHAALPGRPARQSSEPSGAQQRLFNWIPNRIRNHAIAMIGEFVGTFMFLFFAFSATQIANTIPTTSASMASNAQVPNTSALLYISLAFGFSLAVNAWVFFRITGGLFNPAVTLGMCLIGAVPWIRGALIFISQLAAGMASAGVVEALFPGPLLVQVSLSPNTSVVRGLFIEMFLTAELIFTIFMLAAEKHKATFIAPVGIGLALFIAELSGVFYTGGALNPTRAFGPAVVNRSFEHYHWIYWIGPMLGALVAVGFYKLVKALEYETANPGQDADDKEAEIMKEENDDSSPDGRASRDHDGSRDPRSQVNGQSNVRPMQQAYSNQTYANQGYDSQSYARAPQVAASQGYAGAPGSTSPARYASGPSQISAPMPQDYQRGPQDFAAPHNPRYSRRSEEAYV